MFDDLLDGMLEEGDRGDVVAIGIDLGTTNSVVAWMDGDQAVVLADADGRRLHPSVVAWLPNGERAVGEAARQRRMIDPGNTISSAKRIIGQSFRAAGVQQALRQLPYKVSEGQREEPLIHTRGGTVTVAEVSSHVLAHLKAVAERHIGQPVSQCVVTVPANFSDGQRAATRRAAELAGLEVLRIVNEPTAAALAYGHQRSLHQRLAVFDLGGGTFDVSLLAVRDAVYEVLATGGDPFLGGDDLDRLLAEKLAEQVLATHRIDPRADSSAWARLLAAAEEIKVTLSSQEVAEGQIGPLGHGPGGRPITLDYRVERSTLESLVEPMVARALAMTERVLADAGVTPAQVDEVILVGGSTRLPVVQRRVAALFGRPAHADIDPMEVVAMGAAAQARTLVGGSSQRDGVLLDVTPHALRIATAGGFSRVLIAKNTTIPAEGTGAFTTARDDQNTVKLQVCQGEGERFADNTPIGEVVLEGLPKGRRGEVKVEVVFTIDADGLLQVAARETTSGQRAHTTLATVGHGESR